MTATSTFADFPSVEVELPAPEDPIRLGSEAHKALFCDALLRTHDPYKPAVIDWPMLAPAVLKRVTSLPIWDIAVQTEGRASIRVSTYARRSRIRRCTKQSR